MKNNKTLNLLNEVNLMRSMMGLAPKNLLIEGIIPGSLLKSFAKTAVKYASKTAAEIASELGASAKGLKKMFDDLDIAIKAGDEVTAKAMLVNIMSSLDINAVKIIAKDMLSDTADGALTAYITKRTNALKTGGMADDAIRNTVKNDIDTVLEGAPERLKSAVKDEADDIINTTLRAVKSSEDDAALYAKVMQEELELQKAIKDQFERVRLKIEGTPSFGKLTMSEKATVRKLLKEYSNKTPGQLTSEVEGYIAKILADPSRKGKFEWLVKFGEILRSPGPMIWTAAGGVTLLIIILLLSGNIGKARSIYEDNKESWKKAGEESDDESTTVEGCPGENSLSDFINQQGGSLISFDEAKCSGVDDVQVKWEWDSDAKTWK